MLDSELVLEPALLCSLLTSSRIFLICWVYFAGSLFQDVSCFFVGLQIKINDKSFLERKSSSERHVVLLMPRKASKRFRL